MNMKLKLAYAFAALVYSALPVTALAGIQIIDETPLERGFGSVPIFSVLPDEQPLRFGFGESSVGGDFDIAANGQTILSGERLFNAYRGINILLNGVSVSDNTYGGAASQPNATDDSLQIYTFLAPVDSFAIVDTSPSSSLVQVYSGPNATGDLLLEFRDSAFEPTNVDIDKLVGFRTTANETVGSVVFGSGQQNIELDNFVVKFKDEIDCPDSPNIAAFPDKVIDYSINSSSGLPRVYDPVTNTVSITDPANALTVDNNKHLEMPIHSTVTVAFVSTRIIDGPGDDIYITESIARNELADVHVSADGVNFQFLGVINGGIRNGLDLADIGFTGAVNAVRVQATNSGGGTPGLELVSIEAAPASVSEAAVCNSGMKVTSSLPGTAIEITGDLMNQINEVNSGPPSIIDETVFRKRDQILLVPFICGLAPSGAPLLEPYLSTLSPIFGVDEVTYDNCSSAWYKFEFTLPSEYTIDANATLKVNVDDMAVAYLNGSRVSLTLNVPDCTPDPDNGAGDPCYAEQDAGTDFVNAAGTPKLTWPEQDIIIIEANSLLEFPSVNQLVFGVVGDASYFEPTGLEFEMTIPGGVDSDGDGVNDAGDNCSQLANPTQIDSNGDGYGNACDPDIDNNGIVNFQDYFAVTSAFLANPASPNWSPDVDFNDDKSINFADISLFTSFFNRAPGPSGIVP